MIRWIVRIIGLLMLLVFVFMMANLQRRLVEIQRTHRPARSTTR